MFDRPQRTAREWHREIRVSLIGIESIPMNGTNVVVFASSATAMQGVLSEFPWEWNRIDERGVIHRYAGVIFGNRILEMADQSGFEMRLIDNVDQNERQFDQNDTAENDHIVDVEKSIDSQCSAAT